ncbi:MAG: hypothetical protein AB9882_13050 [Ignavibacteriaceae bacterium]
MKHAFTIILLLLFYTGVYAGSASGDSLSFYRIILIDGTEFMGQLSTPDSNNVKIVTNSGLELIFKKDEIKEILLIDPGFLNIDFFATDPSADHLFYFPTARTVPSGKFQFSAYELLFIQFTGGVSKYVEITCGGSFIFPFFNVGAKISPLKMQNVNLAVGARHIFNTQGSASAVFGIGTFTFENISFTSGFGYASDRIEVADFPLIILGGEVQVSNSLKFLTENWILPDVDYAFYSFGIRFFGKKMTGDFGLFYFGIPHNKHIILPWLGFSYNF